MSVTSDQGRRVFALQVAGLPIIYHSGNSPLNSNIGNYVDSGNSISYSYHGSIVSVGRYTAQLDPAGGVGEYGPVSISLTIDERGGSNDPHVTFGRVGLRSASIRSALSQPVLHEDATPFYISMDDSSIKAGLTYPALVHIGAETMLTTAAGAGNTIYITERGVADTPIQTHTQTLQGLNKPEVLSEIVSFRGRRAKLWAAHQHPDGTVSDYVQVINGFIADEPDYDGDVIELSLLPLVALLDQRISSRGKTTRLLHGFHYFEAGRGNVFEWMEKNAESYEFTGHTIGAPNYGGTNTFTVIAGDLTLIADPNLVDSDGNELRHHPRYASFVSAWRVPFYAESYTQDTSTHGGFSHVVTESLTYNGLYGVPDVGGHVHDYYHTYFPAHRSEMQRLTLGTNELKQWPNALVDAAEGSQMASTLTSLAGGWLSWSLSQGLEGWSVVITALCDSVLQPTMIVLNSHRMIRLQIHNIGGTSPPATIDHYWRPDGTTELPLLDWERLHFGVDFSAEGSSDPWPEPVIPNPEGAEREAQSIPVHSYSVQGESVGTTQKYNIKGPALAYYQLYESYILIEDQLDLPSSAGSERYIIQVQYYDRSRAERRAQYFSATHQTAAVYDSSTVGYYIHLDISLLNAENRSFGDWPQYERCEITLAAKYEDQSAGEALLRLLQNGGGSQINGTYDESAIGLNLSSSHIDTDSFLRYAALSGVQRYSGTLTANGLVLRDVVDPLLKAMGAAMLMQRDSATGVSKVALVPMGLESSKYQQGALTHNELHTDPRPRWSIYSDIVTQLEINYDYNADESRFDSTTLFNNQEAITRFGDEQRKISLELYGTTTGQVGSSPSDVLEFFKSLYSRVFRLLSSPLRSWRVSAGTGKTLYTDLGSYWSLTSSMLKGYSDSIGITDKIGMVRSIDQGLMSEGAEMELIHTDQTVTGYAACARITAVSSVTEITVSNEFSGGSTDAAFFAAGDVVTYRPQYDQDSTASLTILTITGGVIEFTTSHGISATGGTIEPTSYSSASTAHQNRAYFDQSQEYI